MGIWVYGEDGITLWVIENRLANLLRVTDDDSLPEECSVLYRPSFGRGTLGIGEFDFILMTKNTVYLGESKWIHSPGRAKEEFSLDEPQLKRHKVFRVYLDKWRKSNGGHIPWADFRSEIKPDLASVGFYVTPDEGTRMHKNMTTVLNMVMEHFDGKDFEIVDLLLFLKEEGFQKKVPQRSKDGFLFCVIEYPKLYRHNFIKIELGDYQ